MLISRRHRIDNVLEICTDLTRTFLNGLSSVVSEEDLVLFNKSSYLISEGYRVALCSVFGLDTEPSTGLIGKYRRKFENLLKPVCNKYNIFSFSLEKKKGLLEACIHCVEKSRKLVGK